MNNRGRPGGRGDRRGMKVFNGLPENILGYNLQGAETRQQSIIRSRKTSHYSSKRGRFF